MRFAAPLTRLVGLWILFGGVFKLLQGSPADLPDALRDLPLKTALLFQVVIGVEFVVGILALLRPSRGWLPALLVLGTFLVVLAMQVRSGAASCGCFGAAIAIPPTVMLCVDGGLALLLLLTRPWRLVPGQRELPVVPVLLIALLSLAGPLLIDRQAKPGETGTDGGPKKWVELELESMVGHRLSETKLWAWLTDEQRIEDGLIVIWRASCEVCAEHLDMLANDEQGERDLVLLELPKEREDEERAVKRMPFGAWVQEAPLPDTVTWLLTPPVDIVVQGGIVTAVIEGVDVLER